MVQRRKHPGQGRCSGLWKLHSTGLPLHSIPRQFSHSGPSIAMVVERWKHFLLIHIDPLLLATIWMVNNWIRENACLLLKVSSFHSVNCCGCFILSWSVGHPVVRVSRCSPSFEQLIFSTHKLTKLLWEPGWWQVIFLDLRVDFGINDSIY